MTQKSYLVFDTETTGVRVKDDFTYAKASAPVQFYGGLFLPPDDLSEWFEVDGDNLVPTGKMSAQQEISMLICLPEGITIEAGAKKIHGLSDELVNEYGMSTANAAHIISDMINVADIAIAHNTDYDRRIINHMMYRENLIDGTDFKNGIWEGTDLYCTMKSLTNVCKIPSRSGGYKWPSLVEAYYHFFGKKFEGDAHDASADSFACAEIYFAFKYLETQYGSA